MAGAVLLVAFLWWQTVTSGPLLPPYAFMDRDRLGCLLALLLAGAGTVVMFSFLTYYLLVVLGCAPARAGTFLLPMLAALAVGSTQVSARLAHRVAPGVLIAVGTLLTAVGLMILAGLEGGAGYVPKVLPGTLLIGLGLGMALMPLFATATAGIAPQHAGAAAAVVATAQQLGEAVGGVLFTAVVAAHLHIDVVQGVPEVRLSAYTTTLWWAAGVMVLAALIAGATVRATTSRDVVTRAAALPL